MDFLEIIIIICSLIDLWIVCSQASDTVTKYDIVDFEILESRTRRDVSDSQGAKTDLELAFVSFGKRFHLLLNKDEVFNRVPTETGHLGSPGQSFSLQDASFYEGVLKNQATRSNVLGFLHDDSLTAWIGSPDGTYFVEPARTFLKDSSLSPRKVAVLKKSRKPQWKVHYWNPFDLESVRSFYQGSRNGTDKGSGLNISAAEGDVFCEVELVADHTVLDHFNRSLERVASFLYLHAKFADRVFRDTDFGMTGRPSGLRIVAGKIFVYNSTSDANYPMSELPEADKNIQKYFAAFLLREQASPFCLSLAAAYRPFPGNLVGLVYAAGRSAEGGAVAGGICDRPIPVDHIPGDLFSQNTTDRASRTYKKIHLNTGVWNIRDGEGGALPLVATLSAFAHQVAHAFGSLHDPPGEGPDGCWGGGPDPFLMAEDAVPPRGGNNWEKLSPCSRKNISDVLLLKGGCLRRTRKPECGNGVKELGEDCDCGPGELCTEVDPCCTANCTFRGSCSPKEQACCGSDCRGAKPLGTPCYEDRHRCVESLCDGRGPSCPAPRRLPASLCRSRHLQLCRPGDRGCSGACALRGLRDCSCTPSPAAECLRCCLQEDGRCAPASDLGLTTSDGQPYVRPAGANCSGGGACDGRGRCVRDGSAMSVALYVAFAGLALAFPLTMVVGMLVALRKRRARASPDASVEPLANDAT